MTVAAVEMEALGRRDSGRRPINCSKRLIPGNDFSIFRVPSHDLRSPLNTITTASGILLTRGLVEREMSLIGRISRATDRMTRMITDLPDVSRVRAETLPMVLRKGDLRSVCREVLDDFQPARPDRRIGSNACRWPTATHAPPERTLHGRYGRAFQVDARSSPGSESGIASSKPRPRWAEIGRDLRSRYPAIKVDS